MSANTINVEELRKAAERIFDAVERAHGSSIAVDDDYYWHLPVQDAFAMNETPSIRQVGQLSDDLAEVRRSVSDYEGGPIVWHDLAHLIGVLRAVEKMALP